MYNLMCMHSEEEPYIFNVVTIKNYIDYEDRICIKHRSNIVFIKTTSKEKRHFKSCAAPLFSGFSDIT